MYALTCKTFGRLKGQVPFNPLDPMHLYLTCVISPRFPPQVFTLHYIDSKYGHDFLVYNNEMDSVAFDKAFLSLKLICWVSICGC